jgi:CHAT domain-containing protein
VHIAHLACHGVQDQEDPLNSGFCLGDGKLTVSNLMVIKLEHAFLAFLSACETAKGDKNLPDQAIHLAAAMLFCGFRSVVATMW